MNFHYGFISIIISIKTNKLTMIKIFRKVFRTLIKKVMDKMVKTVIKKEEEARVLIIIKFLRKFIKL